jgi:hypothetical protein
VQAALGNAAVTAVGEAIERAPVDPGSRLGNRPSRTSDEMEVPTTPMATVTPTAVVLRRQHRPPSGSRDGHQTDTPLTTTPWETCAEMGDAKKKRQQKRLRRELGKLVDEGGHHKREKEKEQKEKGNSSKKPDKK